MEELKFENTECTTPTYFVFSDGKLTDEDMTLMRELVETCECVVMLGDLW